MDVSISASIFWNTKGVPDEARFERSTFSIFNLEARGISLPVAPEIPFATYVGSGAQSNDGDNLAECRREGSKGDSVSLVVRYAH